MADHEQLGVLFVCLGNICRSTTAEAVFLDIVNERGLTHKWVVASAGTEGWNVGCKPDKRTLAVLAKHKIHNYKHIAQQVKKDDFHKYDFILGMDKQNIIELNRMKPEKCKAKVQLFGSYDPNGGDIIEDPYYESDINAFEEVYQKCQRSSIAFINNHTIQ